MMACFNLVFVFLQIISLCWCEIDFQKKTKLENGFMQFYNSLPNEIYRCDEGYLQSVRQTDISNAYDISIRLKVYNWHNLDTVNYLLCTATVADVDMIGVAVMKHQCWTDPNPAENTLNSDVTSEPDVVTEPIFVRRPIQLDNEVQTDTAVTSGEQFIAIPREEPKVHCIGCSSHVNPQAEGVSELAAIGVRQLNALEPNVQHTLTSVVEVERQVQIINGVRYILTILIDYNSCSSQEADPCLTTKACKIKILEKPWMLLPDGSKYRAILSNNCTEEWRFGDDGMIIPPSDNKESNNINPTNPDDGSDLIKAVHNVEVQFQPKTERALTDQDMKNLEDQIIPLDRIFPVSNVSELTSTTLQPPDISKEHVVKVESVNQNSPNSIQIGKPQKVESLDDDKKKSIDELLNFFDFHDVNANKNFEHDDANVRSKRGHPGGINERDPNDPKYKKLAEDSLKKYLENNGNTKPHKVLQIDKVTVQVVAGSLTEIIFKITPTSSEAGDVLNCKSKIWEQPWLNFKEINVTCEIDNANRRAKRDLTSHITEQDPNEPEYRSLAEQSLQKYLENTGNSQPHTVLSVDTVTTKIVAGKVTNIYFKATPTNLGNRNILECSSDILEQPWLKKININVNCRTEENLAKNRVKRGDLLVGGQMNQDPNDKKYQKLAEESLQMYLEDTGNSQPHKIVAIDTVTVQVVSGSLTRMKFKISPTTSDTGDVINCDSKIWEQPWRNFKDIKVNCSIEETTRVKRSIITGQLVDQDPKDPKYTHFAELSLRKYLQDNENTQPHRIISIENVQTQVVAGSKTRIQFKISPIAQSSGDVISCISDIWQRPWLEKTEINVSCDQDNDVAQVAEKKRMKRSRLGNPLPGGVTQEDPTKLIFHNLAEEALKKYQKRQKITKKHIVLEVKQVTSQIVSGTIHNIYFTAAPKICAHDLSMCVEEKPLLDCHLHLKERPWLSERKLDVSCKSKLKRSKRSPHFKDVQKKIKFQGVREVESLDLNERGKREIEHDNVDEHGRFYNAVRTRRSLDQINATGNELNIQKMLKESLEKLEMTNSQRYKQKVVKVNKYSSKITSGKVTTIDFVVAYTSCLKYELVENIEACGLLEHLPRRHCVAEVWERLWLENGRNIEVSCEDQPVNGEVERENPSTATALANQALKHIEAKYPHPRKQKIVRIYSMDKQVVAGIHYRMKVEVGLTNCSVFSVSDDCVVERAGGENKFCRVNVWIRPGNDHPPNFRVTCDNQEGAMADLFHQIQAEHLFRNFLATYNPDYVDDHNEMLKRFQVFKANVRRIHELNIHERGSATYGVTRFADLTYEEFAKKHTGLKPSLRNANQVPTRQAQIPNVTLPDTFDWRQRGAVTEVKDQGSCGSCWAFSVTGNIEGQWQLKSGKLVSLSEQELVDCDKMDDGCNGGLPDTAYRAIEQLGGLETESDYPYEGEDDKCAFNRSLSRVQITGAVNITSNETDMAKWLVANGPISIGINANAMQFYMGGVSHPWKITCSPKNLDHGVLIVGYGVKEYPLFHKILPYWIVKNSWGPSWGEQGYYRVYRGDGTCGVNQMASSAVI